MPILCIDLVIFNDGKILLVKRKDEPLKDEWFFPGGRAHRNELLADAAKRIAENEVGLQIGFPLFMGFEEMFFETDPFNHSGGTSTVNMVFNSISKSKTVKLDKHHKKYQWIDPHELMTGQYHPHLRKYLDMSLRRGYDIEL